MSRVPGVVRLRDGVVDLASERLIRPGREVRLTTLEARLLGYLAEHAGRDVSRAELQDKVWGYGPKVHTRAVDHTVTRLRSKLEVDARNPCHLLTVHGIGYRFVPEEPEPPPPPAPAEPRSLEERTTFVGRGAELSALEALFAAGARLVTIVGPAGAGKTRLARRFGRIAVAEGAARPPERAALFCGFTDARAEHDVLRVLASELGVALPRRREDAVPRLAQALGARGPVLLLCDNLEQVAEHAPRTLGALLDAAPRASLLVTSRVKLGLAGEHVVELGALPNEDARELFEQRARAARPGLELDPPRVHEVVACLDGLPLALELAAANAGALSLRALLDRLRRPADMLSLTAQCGRSMRAALDTSWDRLVGDERAVLARAAVFRDGFTVFAAERVLSPAAIRILSQLRDRSLIEVSARAEVARFRLLETVRAWADEKLGAGHERAEAERAHAHFYLDEAFAEAEPDLYRLAAEHGNLVAVSERFLDTAPELAVRAILALDPLYYARGPGYVHLEMLNRAAAAAGAGPLLCKVLVARCEAWGALGDGDAAEEDAQSAFFAARGDADLEARALIAQGNLRRRQARFDEAYAIYERAAARAAGGGAAALALRQLASCDVEARRYGAALRLFRDLERRYRAGGDRQGLAAVLGLQGNVHNEVGELARAERCFLAALELQRRTGDRRREGILLSNLAVVLHERGQLDESRATWQKALAIHREVVNRRFEGFSIGGLAVLDLEAGRVDAARLAGTEALSIFLEVGDRRFASISRARLAVLAPTAARIREELAAVGDVDASDASALAVLAGFADLADAREARAREDQAGAAAALDRARIACASGVPPHTSFHRISARLLTAWLSRWPGA